VANPFQRRPVDPANCTVIELAHARTGSMLKAARVLAFITCWGILRSELGRSPSVEEYASRFGESAATGYRHQALFREVFDRLDTPDVLLDRAAARQAGAVDRLDLSGVVAA
jgi:hypothetical protein